MRLASLVVPATVAALASVACSSGANPRAADPYTTPASPETLAAIGVATWGTTPSNGCFKVTGYDPSGNPLVRFTQSVTQSDPSHKELAMDVSGSEGVAAFRSTIAAIPDPSDGTKELVTVSVLGNSFPETSHAQRVVDLLEADMNESPPSLAGTSAGSGGAASAPSLSAFSVHVDGFQIPLTNICINLSGPGCGHSLLGAVKTGAVALTCAVGQRLIITATGTCVAGTIETVAGPFLCIGAGASALAASNKVCPDPFEMVGNAYGAAQDVGQSCTSTCGGSSSGSGSAGM